MDARIPQHFPTWAQMLESLDNPSPRALSKLLGVSERTVFNYQRAEQAPRAVMLALFWLTPWGESALNAQRETQITRLPQMVNCLERETAGLRARIARLESTGDFGSANEPVQVPHDPTRALRLYR
jgi:hypothetical protein